MFEKSSFHPGEVLGRGPQCSRASRDFFYILVNCVPFFISLVPDSRKSFASKKSPPPFPEILYPCPVLAVIQNSLALILICWRKQQKDGQLLFTRILMYRVCRALIGHQFGKAAIQFSHWRREIFFYAAIGPDK